MSFILRIIVFLICYLCIGFITGTIFNRISKCDDMFFFCLFAWPIIVSGVLIAGVIILGVRTGYVCLALSNKINTTVDYAILKIKERKPPKERSQYE